MKIVQDSLIIYKISSKRKTISYCEATSKGWIAGLIFNVDRFFISLL